MVGVLMIFFAAGLASPTAAQTEQQAIDWCDNEGGTFSPDQRISGCSALIRANAKDYAAFVSRGLAYYEKNDYDQAIADYTQATKLDPKQAPAFYDRGLAYYKKNDYDHAIADYTQAIQIDPKDPDLGRLLWITLRHIPPI